ncbi:unnamed protein product [Phytophthora fragariaefolia]|uniref:Unnamed protein product n=1 Tax=Phytophthora fragariaefolia TaxID=1490495 RepID=A0A9W6XPU6_9STRA|nr:unnamed protein product [Phytophthora fragariaefolia]
MNAKTIRDFQEREAGRIMSVDPAKVMELLGGLSLEQQNNIMSQAMKDFGEESDSQEKLIQRFMDSRASFVRPGGIFAEYLQAGNISPGSVAGARFTVGNTKPTSEHKSLGTLKPMLAKELNLGTTHRGRYICGWVAVDDAFFGISATSLLLEDVTGHLVEIAAYGLVDTTLSQVQRQRFVADKFPKGKPIAVLEPYYNVRLDGSLGIRVEDPEEIIPWKAVPTGLKTWNFLGNDFFGVLNPQNEGCGALSCYERALQTIQPEVHTIAMLLNNIAVCRFKMSDYTTSIQLSGAAVHLSPCYVKGWLRLALALSEREIEKVGKGNAHSSMLVASIVAHAMNTLPNLTPQQRQLLENTVKVCASPSTSAPQPIVNSYARWCVGTALPSLVVTEQNCGEEQRTADAWRKLGFEKFEKGDFHAAESCYRKGLTSTLSYRRDVSLVLNNISAVYLTLFHGSCGTVVRAGVLSAQNEEALPYPEAALLNSTVAGIIDPLNYKAWTRRVRCLQCLRYSEEECIAELESIRSNVVSKTLLPATDRLVALQNWINSDIQHRSKHVAIAEAAPQVSQIPTHVQQEQRDALSPESISATVWKPTTMEEHLLSSEDNDIDAYIAQIEAFVNATHCALAVSKSNPNRQRQELPPEMQMFLEHSPPQIHKEFPKQRGWPTGIDPVFARKVLYRAYLDASCNPWIKATSIRDGQFFQINTLAIMLKRWHGTAALQMLHDKADCLRYGDIVDYREVEKDVLPAYDARIRSNFANNPNRAEVYVFGTTHIAIGFNDFSSLLAATLRDELKNDMPLRFVGFEMSEFAVAKCKVVARMLGSPDISISSVMEVWLSSTWSKTTLDDFRRSVTEVLLSVRADNESPNVISYLNHWSWSKPISPSKAHSNFFLTLEKYNRDIVSAICSFRHEIDRLGLVHYILTGEILAPPPVMDIIREEQFTASASCQTHSQKNNSYTKKPDNAFVVGSLTMWNVPPGAPPLEADVAFNTVEFMKIVECKKRMKAPANKLSVVDLFMVHILQNLQRLRRLMLVNKLTIEVHHGIVKAVREDGPRDSDNNLLLERIAALRPYTISWSNVLDYFTPGDFHDLARRCSMHGDCLHYGYSMNWPTQVFGVSIIDYDPESDKKFIGDLLDSALGFNNDSQTLLPFVSVYKMSGMDELLFVPLRENPLNSTGYILATASQQKWVEHFMKKGELSVKAVERLGTLCTRLNSGLQVGNTSLGLPSPLYRSSLTLYMSWCYDPTLHLQAMQFQS